TYMGGLCIGSLYLPRIRRAQEHHPLKVYAALELGIAILGLLVLFGIPLVDRIYVAGAEHGLPGMLLRGFISGVCLLPPTILMGASLPAIVRWIKSTPRGVAWWGLLYGGNTVGAVFGCLFAGFYLLRVYDTAVATYAAVASRGGDQHDSRGVKLLARRADARPRGHGRCETRHRFTRNAAEPLAGIRHHRV